LKYVIDNAAQEYDVGSRAYGHMDVGDRAGACESRIDVNDCRSAGLGLHHPAETDRMTLGHIRAFDHNAIGVLQILLKRRCAPSTE